MIIKHQQRCSMHSSAATRPTHMGYQIWCPVPPFEAKRANGPVSSHTENELQPAFLKSFVLASFRGRSLDLDKREFTPRETRGLPRLRTPHKATDCKIPAASTVVDVALYVTVLGQSLIVPTEM